MPRESRFGARETVRSGSAIENASGDVFTPEAGGRTVHLGMKRATDPAKMYARKARALLRKIETFATTPDLDNTRPQNEWLKLAGARDRLGEWRWRNGLAECAQCEALAQQVQKAVSAALDRKHEVRKVGFEMRIAALTAPAPTPDPAFSAYLAELRLARTRGQL